MIAQLPGTFSAPEVVWTSLLPELVLLGGGLLLLVGSALLPRVPKGTYAAFTVVVAGVAMAGAWMGWHRVNTDGAQSVVGGAIALDGFSVFFRVAILSAVILAALLADDYLRREDLEGAEPYAVMLFSALGGMVMAGANDLVVLFLGLETLSLALYVLAASHRRRMESQESGLKYFILGGFSSAFLLYGVALVYGATGSTDISEISSFLGANVLREEGLLLAGMALLLVGLAFKVAAVPFHSWTPDVYQGAPTPFTGFMASAAKAAGFAALLRVLHVGLERYSLDWRPVVAVLAVATLVVGSFTAVVQTDVKRMMAYSSISHAGFVLVGVEAGAGRGTAAALFYLLAYTFMVLGTFGVITLVGRRGDAAHSLEDYRGLGRQRPALALAFTVFLLAQAGVPLTAGFMAKLEVISAAVDVRSYVLAVVAMVSSAVAAFLYLRIVVAMYLADAPADDTRPRVRIPATSALALGLALAFTLAAGIVPSFAVEFARDAVAVAVSTP